MPIPGMVLALERLRANYHEQGRSRYPRLDIWLYSVSIQLLAHTQKCLSRLEEQGLVTVGEIWRSIRSSGANLRSQCWVIEEKKILWNSFNTTPWVAQTQEALANDKFMPKYQVTIQDAQKSGPLCMNPVYSTYNRYYMGPDDLFDLRDFVFLLEGTQEILSLHTRCLKDTFSLTSFNLIGKDCSPCILAPGIAFS